ncbi:MAG TPA: autotransporter domain-containing protein [Rhizobiaceae bacterium]
MRNGNTRARFRACSGARNVRNSKRTKQSTPFDFRTRATFGARLSVYAFGIAFLATPHVALAADVSFSNAADFQSKLAEILAARASNSTLTYTGPTPASMSIDGTVVVPASQHKLTIDLGEKLQIGVAGTGSLTVGTGTTLNVGSKGTSQLRIGGADYTGQLNINGGVVNLSKTGTTSSFLVGYDGDQQGTVRITNGGVLNLGTEPDTKYTQFFTGYNSTGNIEMDNGTINLGAKGASIRLGIGGTSTLDMRNGSVIDSSRGASHMWIGDGAGGTATVNLDNSSIIIKGGGGVNGDDDDRYFLVGRQGGTGVFNQTGDDSLVHLSGLALIGIGRNNGSDGTYNLNGGRLEVGNDTFKDTFQVGVGYGENESTARFNVNGGTADIRGNLEIGYAGTNNKHATATVTLNSGLIDVGGKVVFGKGVGTLNLNGGVLELGGANAITSSATSTINAAGGTLRAGSNLTASHGMGLGLGGITFDSNAHSITYSGVLTGTGGLTKVGEGTLLLTGANTYTGDTLIRGGVIETGHATALGNGGAIVLDGGTLKLSTMVAFDGLLTSGENGGTVDLAAQNINWSGSSDGSGSLKFINGIVTLTGTIGSSGELVLDDGASLVAGADNQLSPASSLDVGDDASFDNGTFSQSVAGLSGTGTISNDGTIDVGGTGASSSFGGTLTGTGNLNKSGDGHFEITGSGDFSGTLGANGGVLSMNGNYGNASVNIGSGGTLGGSGTIGSVSGAAGGTLAPGNSIGTLTVVGDADYDGLTYEVEIKPDGQSDKTVVGGTAYLDGGALSILAYPGVYMHGTEYLILTATNIEGRFADPTISLAFYDAVMDYDYVGGSVSFTLQRNGLALADLANTRNQRTTAGGVESLGEGDAIYDAIFQQDEAGVRTALDALSGEIHATAKTVLIEDARHVRDLANDRVRAAFGGEAGTQGWTRIYGAWGSSGSDGNAGSTDRSLGGVITGADGDLGAWRVGFLGGYSQSSFDTASRASSGSVDSVHVGVYGGRQWDALSLRTGLAYSLSDVDTDRSADFAGFSDDLAAGYHASTFQAFGELGYTVKAGAAAFEPFVNLAHVHLRTDGFTETGEDAALRVAGSGTGTTFSTLGLRLSGDVSIADIAVAARGTMGWRHAMGDTTPVSRHAFAGSSGFTVAGVPVAADALILEAGLGVSLTQAAMLDLSYNGQLASGQSEHSGRIDLAVKF